MFKRYARPASLSGRDVEAVMSRAWWTKNDVFLVSSVDDSASVDLTRAAADDIVKFRGWVRLLKV